MHDTYKAVGVHIWPCMPLKGNPEYLKRSFFHLAHRRLQTYQNAPTARRIELLSLIWILFGDATLGEHFCM